MKMKEYIRMLKSKKKKATRWDELREFVTVSVDGKVSGFRNIATNVNVITKLEYYNEK